MVVSALPEQTRSEGVFFAVVGPSGAGKDTLLDGAREKLFGLDNWHFVKRYINRPHTAGGEDHIEVNTKTFQTLVQEDAFVLHWQAHELHYGITKDIIGRTRNGVNVIANLSRSAIADAAHKLARVHVIYVTASNEVLSKRLKNRGRETHDNIEKRLKRVAAQIPDGTEMTVILNNSTIDEGIEAFIGALKVQTAPAVEMV